ncbi:MAG: DUF4351 domain-containing protein, partial [Thermosynechococcaceae cyanobacterium]
GLFASFVLNPNLVSQILRLDMAVLRESPWLNQMLQESEATGKLEEGQVLVLRQLNRKFGNLLPEVELQVRALDLATVEALGEALLDFTRVDDLTDWLRMH